MTGTLALLRAVREAVRLISRQKGVDAVEAFAADNKQRICRLNYTSDIPCNGVEEPKSLQEAGLGLQVVFAGAPRRLGFGSEAGDFSRRGMLRAYEKAKAAAVPDPFFKAFPSPRGPAALTHYHDPALARLSERAFVALGWQGLRGALDVFRRAHVAQGVIVGGDVTLRRERMAVASSAGVEGVDEATVCLATLTALSERDAAKGTGYAMGTRITRFVPGAAGAQAARSALATRGGVAPPGGAYPVILGPQPVADLVDNMVAPALCLDQLDASASPYTGRFGARIMSPALRIADEGAARGWLGSRGLTCEGLPTGRTALVDEGRLVGVLASSYIANKVGPAYYKGIPRNGFRFSNEGRSFESTPRTAYTNLVVGAAKPAPLAALLRGIRRGLYIGRTWYTYPVSGLAAGGFSSTVVGDSYLVENGRLGRPLRPNTLRLVDNFVRLFENVQAASTRPQQVLVWGGSGIVVAPHLAVPRLRVERIGQA